MHPLLWILLASCAFVYIWNKVTRVYDTIIIPATVKIFYQSNISDNKSLIHGVNSPASNEAQNFLVQLVALNQSSFCYLLWPSLDAVLIVAKPEKSLGDTKRNERADYHTFSWTNLCAFWIWWLYCHYLGWNSPLEISSSEFPCKLTYITKC